jgi:XTP/dITP diphosphohydrolase
MQAKSTLLIATHNRGKVREYARLLADLPLLLTWLDEVGVTAVADETEATFLANALGKAHFYARQTGLLTWADDSGLEVAALGGRPGVLSARYGGEGVSDADRYNLLLRELEGVSDRSARFCCAVAVVSPAGQSWSAEGTLEGTILPAPRGSQGFGYDPVFWVPAQGRSLAELPVDLKNQISHRAAAVAAIRPQLERLCRGEG